MVEGLQASLTVHRNTHKLRCNYKPGDHDRRLGRQTDRISEILERKRRSGGRAASCTARTVCTFERKKSGESKSRGRSKRGCRWQQARGRGERRKFCANMYSMCACVRACAEGGGRAIETELLEENRPNSPKRISGVTSVTADSN